MPETLLSIDALLERMVARNASDLHVTVGTPPAMRVHGILERYQLPWRLLACFRSRSISLLFAAKMAYLPGGSLL